MKIKQFFFIAVACMIVSCQQHKEQVQSLAGEWAFQLDPDDIGIKEQWFNNTFEELITLPGTLDEAGKGIANTLEPSIDKPQILHLTRKHSYIGAAWYKREIIIPSDWKEKNIYLKLERVLWGTSVWIDGKEVKAKGESLIAPHLFDLTEYLYPGKHSICLRIDNRKKYDISVNDMGHAYTNETQIMWNGVIGELSLIAEDALSIKRVDVYPNIKEKNIQVQVHLRNTAKAVQGDLTLSVKSQKENTSLESLTVLNISFNEPEQIVELTYPMGDSFKAWSELTPEIYELSVTLKAEANNSFKQTTFGMRELKQENASLWMNNQRIFLRGTLECCIFPLTGRPPMDKDGWRKVMGSAREWGLNHLRFHSWCPPKAAFEVADEMGFYLQVELPLWSLTVGKEPATNDFLYAEADRIIAEYGNHPSFCFFSMGNELQPDFVFLRNLMMHAKNKDNRHLYTTTSFTFENGHGSWPEPDDDFFITQWTKNGWVRGQGIFNTEPPCFNKDYAEAVKEMTVPLITHEIGQYAVYPNIKEIDKYTGVLDPLNFKGVKKELENKGMIDQADDYLKASGKLAALLYKEEIERALKTPGCSGFQLLDLHDFPGQGTALVGLLDAFWDSKELIDASEFRQFCSPVVPLVRYPKATYTNAESFKATVEIANFGVSDLKNQTVNWKLTDSQGKTKTEGVINNVNVPTGKNQSIGEITCALANIPNAEELTLSVSILNTDYVNSWRIWVYPQTLTIENGDVFITSQIKEAETALKSGRKVLFCPNYTTLFGLEGKFLPVFWSPVHFPKQAGSMGILCNPEHKVFEHFPTRMHTDWQWWHLLTESKTLIIDSLYKEVTPLITCVDNFANNRRLATLFEANCENGKLIVSSMDLLNNSSDTPEKHQLLFSILKYMNSNSFNPEKTVSINKISKLIDPVKKEYKRASAESIY